MAAAQVLPFYHACEQKFQKLRAAKLRIGTRDVRIAATALVHHCTLLTRNHQDFARVPGLRSEDWSVSA